MKQNNVNNGMRRYSCSHCGLPVIRPAQVAEEKVFCCYGCCLVSRIVGKQGEGGPRAWSLLRLSIGALLAMNVMMISLLLYTGAVEPQAVGIFRWILLALSAPAMLILGYPFAAGAFREISRKRLSLDTLIATGAFAAFAVSAANTIRGAGYVYFDTATMLPALVTFGKIIESTAKTGAARLIRGLETLLPAKALRVEAGVAREVDLKALRIGDHLRVRPGERIAVDGEIIEGQTTIEEASFTGESKPRTCGAGDRVFAGTVNGAGSLLVQAERVGTDILLARIIQMVEEARESVSPAERISERIATAFTPGVLALAAGAGIFWAIYAGPAKAAFIALAVIVVACPCAMGIATALATALAIGRAGRSGALVKGGEVLENIGRTSAVFFDKTGTVTTAQLSVQKIETFDPIVTPEEIIGCAASLESASEHPLARAVIAEAEKRGVPLSAASGIEVFPGMGVCGILNWRGEKRKVRLGAREFIGQPLPAPDGLAGTEIIVAWDGRARGRITLEDQIRPDAAEAIRQLGRQTVSVSLLSGDNRETAESVARAAGISQIEAPRRPDEKIEAIRAAARSGKVVCMVGDGINDAPALAAADIGIAMGAATDLSRLAGNVALLSDRLVMVPWLIDLSRYTRRIIAQNLAWAFGYNAVAIAAAAVGWLHPLLAAAAMVFSSVTVLANSARIRAFPEVAGGKSSS